ncbi:hypothetical protein [Rhodococcus sp. NPDC049939]|uniref:hypothetical protein n=1 Tax=Rhodococcus sp. NPDC049939 TaxID=3155511 RepID=UPI0033C1FDA6
MSKTNTIVKRITGGIALAAITGIATSGIAAAETGSVGSLGIGSLAVGSMALGSLGSVSIVSGSVDGIVSGSADGSVSGSAGGDSGGILPPLVEAEVEGTTVIIDLENPNTVETYCGAILFKADADLTDPDAAVWPEDFDPETYEWTREGDTTTYTAEGLGPGDYLVIADCADPEGEPAAIEPIEVTVEESTGSLGSLGLDKLFGSLGSS